MAETNVTKFPRNVRESWWRRQYRAPDLQLDCKSISERHVGHLKLEERFEIYRDCFENRSACFGKVACVRKSCFPRGVEERRESDKAFGEIARISLTLRINISEPWRLGGGNVASEQFTGRL